MSADIVPLFSAEVVKRVLEEASALNLRGATAITVALRNQLAEMKSSGKVPDGRTAAYWARIEGHPEIEDDWADFQGLAAVAEALREAGLADPNEAWLASVRVGLARVTELTRPLPNNVLLHLRNTAP